MQLRGASVDFNRSYSTPRSDLGEKPDNSRRALAHRTLVNREIGDLDGPLGEQSTDGARAAPSITLLIRRVLEMKARKLAQLGPVSHRIISSLSTTRAGGPITFRRGVSGQLRLGEGMDSAIASLRALRPDDIRLTEFERYL